MIALNRTTLNRRIAVARRARAHTKREAAAGPHPVAYTIVDSRAGRLLVAATERGICSIKLGDSDAALEGALRREFPDAARDTPPGPLQEWIDALLAHLTGAPRAARGRARHAVPAARMGRAAADPDRLDPELCGRGTRHRPAARGTRGRSGVRHEPGRPRRPLPPRGAAERRPRRLSLGREAQGAAARGRACRGAWSRAPRPCELRRDARRLEPGSRPGPRRPYLALRAGTGGGRTLRDHR